MCGLQMAKCLSKVRATVMRTEAHIGKLDSRDMALEDLANQSEIG